MGMFAVSAM